MAKKGQIELKLSRGEFALLRDWLRGIGLSACTTRLEDRVTCLVALDVWERMNKKGEVFGDTTFRLQRYEAFAVHDLGLRYATERLEAVLTSVLAVLDPFVVATRGAMKSYYEEQLAAFEKHQFEERPFEEQVAIADEVNRNLAEKCTEDGIKDLTEPKTSPFLEQYNVEPVDVGNNTPLPKETYSDVIKRILRERKEKGG